jgi:hypothetical protein
MSEEEGSLLGKQESEERGVGIGWSMEVLMID